MRYSTIVFAVCSVLLMQTAACLGHGFAIRHDNGQIHSYVSGVENDTFAHSIALISAGPPYGYASHHGFFTGLQDEDEFGNPVANTLPGFFFNNDDTFQIRAASALWHSAGSGADRALTGTTLEGYLATAGYLGQGLRIDGSDSSWITGDNGVTWSSGSLLGAPGDSTHAMNWELMLDGGLTSDSLPPVGVYGFAYEIQAFINGDVNAPYDPTTVVVLFHTAGFDPALLPLARQQVYDALMSGAVPEPSTWALMGASVLGIGAVVMRRRRQSRAA